MLIQINGTTITAKKGTVQIADAIGQRSTARFLCWDTAGASIYDSGNPVSIYADDGTTLLFSGFINTAVQGKPSPTLPLLTYNVSCMDRHYLADKRIVAASYVNTLAGDIFGSLLANYLWAEGVLGTRTAPTFARSSIAFDDVAVQYAANVPRYAAGQFGNAILIEGATTNLLSANQSNVETNTTGFASQNSTMTRVTTDHWEGSACLQAVTTSTSSDSGFTLSSIAGTAGTTYACSAWVKALTGSLLKLIAKDNTNNVTTTVNFTATGAWQRVSGVVTYGVSSGTGLQIKVLTQGAQPLVTILADGFQIEQQPFATRWQAVSAARTAEALAIPASGVLSPTRGTIRVWAYVDGHLKDATATRYLFDARSGVGTSINLQLYHTSGGNFVVQSQNGGSASTASYADTTVTTGWHQFAVTYSPTLLALSIDGVLKASTANPNLPVGLANLYLGSIYGGASGHAYTLFDDLHIAAYDLTAVQLLASYNTGAAIGVVDCTTYYVDFNSNINLQNTIKDGPTIGQTQFSYITGAQCMDQLATAANFWWEIDEHDLAHFGPTTLYAAPFTADGTIMDEDSVSIQRGNPNYRNRQYVKGGTDVTSSQTETRIGDGVTRAFTVSYPFNNVPIITLNGSAQTVGSKSVNTGSNWYWSKGDPVLAQDTGGTLLTSSDTLSVTYVGLFNVIVRSDDTAAITSRLATEGTGTGYVEAAEDHPEAQTSASSFAIASSLLSKYAVNGRIAQFQVRTAGLKPGQLLTVNLPSHNINNEAMLIESINIRDDANETVTFYQVKAVEGPVDSNWVTFFATLAQNKQTFVDALSAGASSVLVLAPGPYNEAWTWSEAVTETLFACPVCGPSTFCGPSTIVC